MNNPFSNLITFSSYEHASDVVRRLDHQFLDKFEHIAHFVSLSPPILASMVNVTASWHEMNESTKLAFTWDIFPGIVATCVVFEDDEFGMNISWYFSENSRRVVSLKELIIIVEAFMNLIVKVSMMGEAVHEVMGAGDDSKDLFETGQINAKSDLFCFNLTNHNFFPVPLSSFTRRSSVEEVRTTISRAMLPLQGRVATHHSIAGDIVARWQVLNGIHFVLTMDEARGGRLSLMLSPPGLLSSAIRQELLIIGKMHLDIISSILQYPD
ncbi:MAG: hypothetical protein ACTSUE_19510 [Promethearchaeota archaeon]